ncbi:methionyl-tRNA formyltransferase-like [Aplysia californica]|uniref:Methionyl-tRNA formyltransferase-like n=1 Tax=Aplysia californica TaxID=6500 RepID=A0ABM1VWF6_APLCA|nr:methionyl-tRNA formyltransferase-like [Aplysia californica]
MGPFSCVVIGEGNAAFNCLQHLLDKGCAVNVVFTNTEDIFKFCDSRELRVLKRNACIEECIEAKSFDYLFSVNNPRILSPEVLSLPRCFSINYHDSPLPQYAGVNATCWALLRGETTHGISWHIVEPGIDTGDILQAQSVQFPSA